jgi:hypothetical protein
MIIQSLKFLLTCGACPEQYDVFHNGKQVGYVRLRWGVLRVDCPDVGGETVYSHSFDDPMKGCFDNESESMYHLTIAAEKLLERVNQ